MSEIKIAVVGDTHGNISWVAADVIPYAVKNGCEKILQVGDFGFLWPGREAREKKLRKLDRLLAKAEISLHFLPGNHEDHDLLAHYAKSRVGTPEGHYKIKPRIFYTGRVSSWEWDGRKIAAVGGGVSIDRDYRQRHELQTGEKIWWPREVLDGNEVRAAKAIGPVDVLFTHDAPTSFPESWIKPDLESTANRQRMTDIGRALTPRVWLHGHYHCSVTYPFHHDRGVCEVRGLSCDESSRLDGIAILDLRAP